MSKSKSIWLINQYTSTPKLGGGGNRSYYIAKELVRNGHNVTLITSSYSHVPKRNYKIDNHFHFENEENINLVVIKNVVYESGKSVLRILSMLIFWLKLYFLPLKKITKPDIIVVSSISLLPILNALRIKSIYKNKPNVILEIRDIWPLSLIDIGGYSKFNPFILFLNWIEKKAYIESDYVTSVLPFAHEHIYSITRSNVSFKHISNGIHLESIQLEEPLSSEIKELLPVDKFLIGYTGALGIANAMDNFIDLALSNRNDPNFYFVIVGDGYLKDSLKMKANGLDNILFLDRIPKAQVQSILKTFDLLYIAWHHSDIYKYGISANKIFDYMYSGKPILMVGNIKNTEIDIANCGKVIYSSDLIEVNKALKEFFNMSLDERKRYGIRGKDFIVKYKTYEYLTQLYLEIFEEFEKNIK